MTHRAQNVIPTLWQTSLGAAHPPMIKFHQSPVSKQTDFSEGDNTMIDRRSFLKLASAAGVLLGIGGTRGSTTNASVADGHAPIIPAQGGSSDDMDKAHEDGVKYFLDNIGKDKDFWGPLMPFTMDGDTKVFEIVCTEAQWEVSPGQPIDGMLYNGRIPGPVIRVTEGDKIRVNVTNNMTQSTSIHWHGIHTPNPMDGVPYVTQPVIKPGAKFTYEFQLKNSGSHMYHSHHNAAEQVTRGQFGAFIVDPADKSGEPQVNAEYIMVLNDAGVGFTLNGRTFPATQPIIAKKGDRIRIRYMNEGLQIHPMHLHGMYQQVFAKDGAKLPTPYLADTLNVAPGERYDVLIDCQEPGVWAFHCHILTHAESNRGMFGMVTALVIK